MIGFMAFVMAIVVVGLGILGVAAGLRRINAPEQSELEKSRLDRLESALSAMESRLDDLQDQQRFLERLLAERPEPGALGPGTAAEGGAEDASDGGSILFDTEPEEGR